MRTVVLDQVTLCADGSISIRFLKQIVDDGEVIFAEPHRTVVDPLGSAADQIALVNTHLEAMGYSAVPESDIAIVEQLQSIYRQDGKVAVRVEEIRVARAEAEKALEAENALAEGAEISDEEISSERA